MIGHTHGMPQTWNRLVPVSNPLEAVARDLDSSIARARAAGIDRRHIVIDPGLSMGKRGPENYQILRNLERLAELGQPLQVSPSRKQFLVESVRAPDSERLFATARGRRDFGRPGGSPAASTRGQRNRAGGQSHRSDVGVHLEQTILSVPFTAGERLRAPFLSAAGEVCGFLPRNALR